MDFALILFYYIPNMAHLAFDYISPTDYLNAELRATAKQEYFDGRIYAMAGASLNHNYIVANLSKKINALLAGDECILFSSDLRIATPASDAYMYPDLSIVCGTITTQDNNSDTVTNPTVIIEVMSPSTRGYDLAFKFHFYKQITSLKEYLLIDSERHFVQIHRRDNNNLWQEPLVMESSTGEFAIATIEVALAMQDVYNKVVF